MPRSRKRRTFPWRPVAIYVAAVAIAGAALVAWDRAYEARLAPPSPEIQATNLVERILGPGTVQSVKLDTKTGTLDLTVKDILSQDAKNLDQKKKFLTGEATQVIQSVLSVMVTLKKINLTLVNNGKVLATVRVEPGVSAPTTEFAPDLK